MHQGKLSATFLFSFAKGTCSALQIFAIAPTLGGMQQHPPALEHPCAVPCTAAPGHASSSITMTMTHDHDGHHHHHATAASPRSAQHRPPCALLQLLLPRVHHGRTVVPTKRTAGTHRSKKTPARGGLQPRPNPALAPGSEHRSGTASAPKPPPARGHVRRTAPVRRAGRRRFLLGQKKVIA